MTGYPDDGEAGKEKINSYYWAFMQYIHNLQGDTDFTFILDRTFFSEAVYSKLYKSYDFSKLYQNFLTSLYHMEVDIRLFFFQAGIKTTMQRLNRDKRDFFSKYESREEILKQQDEYFEAMRTALAEYNFWEGKTRACLSFYPIVTDYREPDELLLYVKNLVNMEPQGKPDNL